MCVCAGLVGWFGWENESAASSQVVWLVVVVCWCGHVVVRSVPSSRGNATPVRCEQQKLVRWRFTHKTDKIGEPTSVGVVVVVRCKSAAAQRQSKASDRPKTDAQPGTTPRTHTHTHVRIEVVTASRTYSASATDVHLAMDECVCVFVFSRVHVCVRACVCFFRSWQALRSLRRERSKFISHGLLVQLVSFCKAQITTFF